MNHGTGEVKHPSQIRSIRVLYVLEDAFDQLRLANRIGTASGKSAADPR